MAWHERDVPGDMNHEELADAKQHLMRRVGELRTELDRVLGLIAHLDNQILTRFNLPLPEGFILHSRWELTDADLPEVASADEALPGASVDSEAQ